MEVNMQAIKESKNKKEINSYLTVDAGDIVTLMEKEWPEMTIEFKRLQGEQYKLFCHKQHDYGPGNISVGTQLQTEDEIHLSLTGLWFRMNDKIQRLKNLLMSGRENAVEGEPMEDAFLDVSNYGIMATIVKNGKWGK
jgi:ribonuclease I